jgi:hypothetical protein
VSRARLPGLRCLVCLLFLAIPALATAQDTPFVADGSRPVIRPDGTYFFNHAPRSDLVFEAQIAPRILILDSVADTVERVLVEDPAETRAHWAWSLSATPMVKMRMFDETSSPVRTPSYMPKGNVQLIRMKNLSTDESEQVRYRGPVSFVLIDVIPFGHHSNGQNGCLFTNQVRGADDECAVDDTSAPRAVNKIDGSFSTNYIEATAHYGRLYLAPGQDDFRTRVEWRVGGGVQVNPKGFAGGSISDELAPLYGQTRLLFEANAAARDMRFCGRAESQLQMQYIDGAPTGVPAVTAIVEGNCLPRRWGGTGLFVRFYRGQDYYNLGFAEEITRLQFGVTLQRATFLAFPFE